MFFIKRRKFKLLLFAGAFIFATAATGFVLNLYLKTEEPKLIKVKFLNGTFSIPDNIVKNISVNESSIQPQILTNVENQISPKFTLVLPIKHLIPSSKADRSVEIKVFQHSLVRYYPELFSEKVKFHNKYAGLVGSNGQLVYSGSVSQIKGWEVSTPDNNDGKYFPDIYSWNDQNGPIRYILECTSYGWCAKRQGEDWTHYFTNETEDVGCQKICTDRSGGNLDYNVSYTFDKSLLDVYENLNSNTFSYIRSLYTPSVIRTLTSTDIIPDLNGNLQEVSEVPKSPIDSQMSSTSQLDTVTVLHSRDEATDLLKLITDTDRAVKLFFEKCVGLPGDIINPKAKIKDCVICYGGNGDGHIGEFNSVVNGSTGENKEFWQHLKKVGFITDYIQDKKTPNISVFYYDGMTKIPFLYRRSGMIFGNYLRLNGEIGATDFKFAMDPEVAELIDAHLDDGLPNSGNVIAAGTEDCVITNSLGISYNVYNKNRCVNLYVRMIW